MRHTAIALSLLLCLSAAAVAQQPTPQYWVAAGAGWNHYSAPQALGWVNAAVRLTENNYSLTSIDMTSVNASIRTGFARILTRKGNWGLLLLGDAGVMSGADAVTGAFGAGGAVTFDLSRFVRADGIHLVVACRVLKSGFSDGPLNHVKPVFEFGFSKSF